MSWCRKHVAIFLGILILSTLPGKAGAQKVNFFRKTYTVEDGLPNNHVRWITEDQTGFLWICTWDGLARFDGSEFKIYRHNPDDSNSVAFFEIIKACVDSNNQLWVIAGGRLCRYEPSHDHFIRYNGDKLPLQPDGSHPMHYHDIIIDPDGHLLVYYGDDLFKYNSASDRFEEILLTNPGINALHPSFLSFDNQRNLWLFRTQFEKECGQLFQCAYHQNNSMTVIDSFAFDQENFRGIYSNETIHIKIYNNSPGWSRKPR